MPCSGLRAGNPLDAAADADLRDQFRHACAAPAGPAAEHATQRHPRELMVIYGMGALMYFAYCYPVLRLAR
jgi:hypothetical protein